MPLVAIPPEPQLAPLLHAYRVHQQARRSTTLLGAALLLGAVALACWGAEIRPGVFWAQIGHFGGYFERLTELDTGARVWTDPVYWFWGLRRWLRLLGETVLIAYVGTLSGAALAVAGGLLSSSNLVSSRWLRIAVKRALELCRTVPDIVFALVFVVAFGLGGLPGVLAITLHTAGTLGKLFAEVTENIDPKPLEGALSTGAAWLARVRLAVLPQVLSSFVSYGLLRFEINVRSSTIIGFVGAGGIGQELRRVISFNIYEEVSAIVILILLIVVAIDLVSERIRHRFIGSPFFAVSTS